MCICVHACVCAGVGLCLWETLTHKLTAYHWNAWQLSQFLAGNFQPCSSDPVCLLPKHWKQMLALRWRVSVFVGLRCLHLWIKTSGTEKERLLWMCRADSLRKGAFFLRLQDFLLSDVFWWQTRSWGQRNDTVNRHHRKKIIFSPNSCLWGRAAKDGTRGIAQSQDVSHYWTIIQLALKVNFITHFLWLKVFFVLLTN